MNKITRVGMPRTLRLKDLTLGDIFHYPSIKSEDNIYMVTDTKDPSFSTRVVLLKNGTTYGVDGNTIVCPVKTSVTITPEACAGSC